MWYGTGLRCDHRELQLSAGLSFDLSDIGFNLDFTDLYVCMITQTIENFIWNFHIINLIG